MYKRKLAAAKFVRKSRLILGLDLVANTTLYRSEARIDERKRLAEKARSIIRQTSDHVIAYKFNRHLVLPLGLYDEIPGMIESIHDLGLTAIMDCKINDIGHSNEVIAKYYLDAGFDAVIVNPFVGWDGGLDSVFKVATERSKGIISLCYMSHPGSEEGYGLKVALDEKGKKWEPLYIEFARRAKKWEADGVIVGATYPERITEVKNILGDTVPILSPGVGAQGGSASDAIQAGAEYVIVARSIINADNPTEAARTIAEQTMQ